MTLSLGLRFETQTQINDHADFAPRLGFAWGLGHGKTPPKTVLRAGFGIFYDRFVDSLLLQAEQLNGVNQEEIIQSSPGGASVPTIYQVNSRLHTPYVIQTAVAVERQISNKATVAVTYLNSRGFDQLVLRNINAPLTGSNIQPFGAVGNVYQYESEAVFRQNQLITNFRVSVGSRLSLFGFYSLSYANGDTGAGASTGSAASSMFTSASPTVNFQSNQYNILADYGRTAFDIRHRFALGGTIALPYAFRLSPFILATSGRPYNITVGQDLNGDSIFNDRPSFAAGQRCDNAPSCFNPNPGPGDVPIPINYGTGPGQFTLNMRLSKTFGLGKKLGTTAASGGPGGPGGGRGGRGGGPGGGLGPRGLSGGGGGNPFGLGSATNRRYNLTFSIAARNLLNTENLAPPVGVVTSPSFGRSNTLAGGPFGTTSANRRIDLQAMFTF
jgi:hypothetical protein